MSFKHPEFLYLLFVVLIPVIIHLFNFRRYKKLWFSNIQFLKNITTETRKQNKLKHLVILLTRIIAIVFIVLAFAGPELNKQESATLSSSSIAALYIDNSFSMMSEGINGRLFEESVKQAKELGKQMPRDKQFVLVTNEINSGRRLLSKDAFLAELNNISISANNRKLSSVIRTVDKTRLEKGFDRSEMYLMSDFQRNAFDQENLPEDSLGYYYFLPQRMQQKRNIFIDSCWISEPVILQSRPIELKIRLVNASDIDLDKIPLKVSVNEQQKAVASVDVKAGSAEIVTVNFTVYESGWQTGVIEIEDYPIVFDDKLYFAFSVQSQIKVLEINSKESQLIRSFYETETLFDYRTMNFRKVDYNKFRDFDLIILNGFPSLSTGLISQVKDYALTGKNVFFIPGKSTDRNEINIFLNSMEAGRVTAFDTTKTRVIRINQESELFRDAVSNIPENADFPIVYEHFKYQYPISSELESLISLVNGDDFLLKKNMGNGIFYMLASPLEIESGTFISNALFVPVMYNAAVQGKSMTRLFYIIGEDNLLEINHTITNSVEKAFTIIQHNSEFSLIPEQKISNGKLTMDLHSGIQNAGFYLLTLNDSVYHNFAFNYNRNESQMDFLDNESLQRLLDDSDLMHFEILSNADNNVSTLIKSLQKENDLWKLFIILALLMLLAEVLILRFWK